MPECPPRKPSVVPYVVAWSAEFAELESMLDIRWDSNGPRLGYKDEKPSDRVGRDEVLWGRMTYKPGAGIPLYDYMHPGRQYFAMRWMTCQVCGEPASRNEDGWLFLDWHKQHDPPTWPEGSVTAMPPLCDLHAHVAIAECPHLRNTRFLVLRVRTPRIWGYSGAPYSLTREGWSVGEHDVRCPIGDPNLRAVLGSRLYRELRNITVVSEGIGR
ncbi:hypothetical protein [Streptomyces sp. A1-5]|uniref:hypothetical protein n=1 Tax=Streptomyces sp. A1-5 TaxID=2738410 RepID=UPI001F159CC5|nr:hypothetical protein [Streptomyces sp. A1-5]UJB43054.1 hypothetical protein HRD51_21475 [Streptomyces sp. A1-5]